ncbi:Phosphorylase superfamily protein [Aspergillus parasiticus SU-1]|uniref:Nucleoside phosphorylase domain-containing protein n=2 Tax=Aspergillus parasiticus TaxID=5067 RepID=A0A5N6DQR0_ASPPA|nr:nucleoside phosphorylase domain-containing protein [Aspergillus parasiticus]KJK67791.1 Phosphorylase superfamily protein [Aspergillus parasiticus SU-1]
MWSRYSKRLFQRPGNRDQNHRDLLETHSQSLGYRQLGSIKIDCSFMPDSQWGILQKVAGAPAWLLYLQLQFSQPSDCKLANANVQLTFEKMTPANQEPISLSNLGPVLTEYFGPRGIVGNDLIEPVVLGSTAVNAKLKANKTPGSYQDAGTQWSLQAYTWPVEGDNSGLHRRVEWIIKEADSQHQPLLHRGQVRVALVVQHDLEPFFITVRIEGQLHGDRGWFKFPSSMDSSTRHLCVRVSPSAHEQTPLDERARQLNRDMTALLVQSFRPISKLHKGLGSEEPKRTCVKSTRSAPLAHRPTSEEAAEYTIGWICALPLELATAEAMLDKIHDSVCTPWNDQNNYTLGNIGPHNIVVAGLPAGTYGTTSAATVATRMLATFPSIRFSLMVGIGGGVPSSTADIRLGDIVVSKPNGRLGGVVQYDYGKTVANGIFEQTGALNKPPQALLTTVAKMQAEHIMRGDKILNYISQMVAAYPRMQNFTYPGQERDYLFRADYDHEGSNPTCENCDSARTVDRKVRMQNTPVVHYGTIASGNQVIKHGQTRDRIAQQQGILCFEMEAAGLMDNFPCLVIRGICDYADSHKNKDWQEYAAATAAAYAKEFISMTPARQVEITPKAVEV